MSAAQKKPQAKNYPQPNKKSERVVIDEIFDDGTARVLRATRLPDITGDDFSIGAWGEEREEFIKAWRIEAFVGFPPKHYLREGDVFWVADGTKLTSKYKPIPRDKAELEHLLVSWDDSREIARREIKKQFYKLAAAKMTPPDKDIDILVSKVDKKFADDSAIDK